MYYILCNFLAICFANVFLMSFQTFIFFTPKSREVTSQNRLYLNFFPESDFSFTRRRIIDVRRVMPSFMSISARVQELFRENRGGGKRPPPSGDYGLIGGFVQCIRTHKSIENLSDIEAVSRKGFLVIWASNSELGAPCIKWADQNI